MTTCDDTFALAVRRHREGDLEAARDLYCAVLDADPKNAGALHMMGVLACQADRPDLGAAWIANALALDADDAGRHFDLGEAYRALGQPERAEACYRDALRLRPDLPEADNNLGLLLMSAGRLDEAEACFLAALGHAPHFAAARHNLGLVLTGAGRFAEAVASLRRAAFLDPHGAAVHYHLGNALWKGGHLDEAADAYRRAVLLRPDLGEAHNNLGSVLRVLGRLDEAEDSYRAALRHRPDDAGVLNNLANVLKDKGLLAEALACYRAVTRARPDDAGTHANLLFCLNYDPATSAAALADEHRRWGERFGHVGETSRAINVPDPQRRLRVGYVSPDFRDHAVAHFVEPILAHHDPAAVEVFCYAEVAVPDAVTARLRHLAHVWRPTGGLSDAQVADQIRADGIDVLVDLAGHTAGNRLRAFAREMAPVRISYLGYPNTTGLPSMTYRLTDGVADPPGSESLFTEELIRLPRGFCCFTVPEKAPPVGPLPALRNGHVTFGSPHNLAKLNDAVLDLWAGVLRAVPSSRLCLFRSGLTGASRDRLATELTSRGIDPMRLEWLDVPMSRLGYGGYLGLYGGVDVVLDSFPAGAHTTACEALVMGVPVVTLYGDRTFGRQSASVLRRVGLGDGVAATPAEYVALARRWAADPRGLAELRAGLRERVAATPGDAAGFTRDLEAAYRDLWRRWCAGATP